MHSPGPCSRKGHHGYIQGDGLRSSRIVFLLPFRTRALDSSPRGHPWLSAQQVSSVKNIESTKLAKQTGACTRGWCHFKLVAVAEYKHVYR